MHMRLEILIWIFKGRNDLGRARNEVIMPYILTREAQRYPIYVVLLFLNPRFHVMQATLLRNRVF